MKIQEMYVILEIIKSGSISEAAKNLYISQPALSQTLKKIEQELGYPLFVRHKGKALYPTHAGRCYEEMAKSVLPAYEHFLQQLDDEKDRTRTIFRVGVPSGQGHLVIDALLTQKKEQNLNVYYDFHEGASHELEKLVKYGELDFAVLRLPLDIPELRYHILCCEPLGIWLRPDSPQAAQAVHLAGTQYPSLPLSCLDNEVLLLPPRGKRQRTAIDRILEEAHVVPLSIKSYDSRKSIFSMVSNGMGSTISRPPEDSESGENFYWILDIDASYDLALIFAEEYPRKQILKKIADGLTDYIVPHPEDR